MGDLAVGAINCGLCLKQVLLWLKQWDSTVFGSEIRSTSDDVLSALKRHSSISHKPKPMGSNFPRTNGGHNWSSNRYTNSRSTAESGNSTSIQDIRNTKSRNIGAPEQKVLLSIFWLYFHKFWFSYSLSSHIIPHLSLSLSLRPNQWLNKIWQQWQFGTTVHYYSCLCL
jgi:hypothetical protein